MKNQVKQVKLEKIDDQSSYNSSLSQSPAIKKSNELINEFLKEIHFKKNSSSQKASVIK